MGDFSQSSLRSANIQKISPHPYIKMSKTVALQGLIVYKDDTLAACESIKEDAQDVYAEAKNKAKNGDGPQS